MSRGLSIRLLPVLGLAASLYLPCHSASAATYTTFAVKNFTATHAISVNDAGTVTGEATDSDNKDHGFVRTADGTITIFDPPGSLLTNPMGIDNDGTIAGTYGDGSLLHGFVRKSDGTFTAFDPRNVTGTYVVGIDGAIVGSGTRTKTSFGFLRSKRGRFEEFRYPYAIDTTPHAVNGTGTVVGIYHGNRSGNARSFMRHPDGTFETFDVGQHRYFPAAINDDGAVTGDAEHGVGFFRSADGAMSRITITGMLDVEPSGIAANGEVVGTCYDENFNTHGFVWTVSGGSTTFDVPGSSSTSVTGVSPNGQITGTYNDQSGGGSFLRTE